MKFKDGENVVNSLPTSSKVELLHLEGSSAMVRSDTGVDHLGIDCSITVSYTLRHREV